MDDSHLYRSITIQIGISQPTVVPSPSYTLKMQSGNSLDFSIVLASLLLGVGYDAFVCSGYADRKVTEMDELTTDLPLEKISLEDTSSLGAAQPSDPLTERKYNIKTLRQLKSNFLTKQFEKEKAKVDQAQGLLKNATPVQELQEQATPQDVDEYEGLRLHFWVLVLPGQREIADPFFIEATTGKIYPVDHASYLGVESVFNSYNYWVNMQTCFDGLKVMRVRLIESRAKVSLLRQNQQGISFDLGDNSKWEFIFLDNAQTGRLQKKNNKSDDKTGSRSLDDDEIDGKTKEVLDVPPSWVERLDIDKAKFELRAPSGVKTIHYKNASLEEFAPYVRNDGLVSRVTVLENVKDNTPMEIRESFENRK